MGTKNNPGKFDCYAAADPDEPLFTLLGRDRLAPFLIEMWIAWRCGKFDDATAIVKYVEMNIDPKGLSSDKQAEAETCIKAMRTWRIVHEARDRSIDTAVVSSDVATQGYSTYNGWTVFGQLRDDGNEVANMWFARKGPLHNVVEHSSWNLAELLDKCDKYNEAANVAAANAAEIASTQVKTVYTPTDEQVESLAIALYTLITRDNFRPPWVQNGNSLAQEACRATAKTLFETFKAF